jgi:hypothetical protein
MSEMLRKRSGRLAVTATVSIALAATFAPGAHAAPVISGDLLCVIGATPMSFTPALVLAANNPLPTKSRDTAVATATACRGTTPSTPAPGGIHHGLIELKGRLKQNSCEDLTAVAGYSGTSLFGPQRLRVTWYDASGKRIGRTPFGAEERSLMLSYDLPGYPSPLSPIATIPFSKTLRSGAKAFGGERVVVAIPHDLTAFSLACAAGPVAQIPLLAGVITIGNPS